MHNQVNNITSQFQKTEKNSVLLLIGELADKGKENKYKYYADRFKDKKKARTNVGCQNLPQVLSIS